MRDRQQARPAKKRVMTSFEIGELKEPWEQYCQARGVKSVEALRRVIQKLIDADEGQISQAVRKRTAKVAEPPYVFTMQEGTEKRQHRLYLTLTESELRAVEARAQADGFGKSTAWAAALIRAKLTDEPQFGSQEIDALGESNQQLLAIGRNLNQIAHALNAAHGNSTIQYDSELVENLASAVKKHVKKVGDALRASIYRWTLK